MTWLRLEAAFAHDTRLDEIGFWGRVTFVGALCLTKMHGWSVGYQRGFLPARDFTARAVLRYWDCASTPGAERGVRDALRALIDVGMLVPSEEPAGWWIANWRKYQPDPQSAERQRRHRSKEDPPPRDESDARVTSRNAVTGAERQRRFRASQARRHGMSRDVTARTVSHADVTGRDGSSSSKPEGLLAAAASATRTRARRATEPPPPGGSAPASGGPSASPPGAPRETPNGHGAAHGNGVGKGLELQGSELAEALRREAGRWAAGSAQRAAIENALALREDGDLDFDAVGRATLREVR